MNQFTPILRAFTKQSIQLGSHQSLKALPVAGSSRFLSIDSAIKHKEKVEEDLYIRHKEQEIRESRMRMEEALMAQTQEQLAAEDVARADAMIAAIKVDVAKVLLKTHDKISPEGLENLAKWRVGH